MTFSGFRNGALPLLTDIGVHDREWFNDRREDYAELLVGPVRDLVTALGEQLTDQVSPTIAAVPRTNGSIAPINNDLRFAPDRNPYKDHLLLRFWDGEPKRSAPTLFVRISEDSIGFASGRQPERAELDAWRRAVAGPAGAQLQELLEPLLAQPDAELAGQTLKRVPKPYPSDDPRADLLRCTWFQVRWPEPTPAEVGDAGFVEWCMVRLRRLAPVHAWLLQQAAES